MPCSRLVRFGAIGLLVAGACGAGALLGRAGVPAAGLFGGMLVGVAVALAPGVRVALPARLYTVVQALLGAAIAGLARMGIGGSVPVLAALPLVLVATILLSVAAGRVLSRRRAMGRATALLGMVAGGSAGMVAVADEVGADARAVAVMQYVRVAIVAATVPLVVAVMQARGHHAAADVPSARDSGSAVAMLLAVALAGAWLGARVRLPASALAGPLILGTVLAWTGVLPDAPVPGVLPAVALTVIGLEIGLRFDRGAVRATRRLLPATCALTAALMAGCAGIGALLSAFTGVAPVDAYLMTTPGGINAVLGVAVGLKGVDLALVTVAQTLRLVAMVVVAPRLIQRLA
jgi:membrane AbrB-like protein